MTVTYSVVADIMTADVTTISPRDTLEFVEEAMEMFRFRHLPVEEDGRLLGVLTHRDVLRTAASSLVTGAEKSTEKLRRRHPVADVMTRNVKTVGPDMRLAEAAKILADEKIGCLPVVDDGKLVGIVTEHDFVRLAAKLLGQADG
jgi:CBS domain-containing membrane protein